MPTICRFYGILIFMNYLETESHIPHFHARYGGFKGSYAIRPLDRIAGKLPPTAERLVLEWAALHEQELLANYQRARARRPLLPIQPME
jgi:hypothetical protein